MEHDRLIIEKVRDTLVRAGSIFREDQKEAYRNAISKETLPRAKWVLQTLLENAEVAERNHSPLCDDTGIPHLFLEAGPNRSVSGALLESIKQGVADGLRMLPGRPMGIKGNDEQRLDQSGGLDDDPAAVLPAPIIIKPVEEDVLRLHVLLFGGGPAIRGKTHRVFHKHSVTVITDEIISWARESVSLLGCSPCVLTVGIGRSQFEASSLMIEAMVYGSLTRQSKLEKLITDQVNASNIGPLGLNGDMSVLATLLKVGPQRASGVRVVCLRPSCCIEPRIASVLL